ncbi:MAG: hypothetical protein ACTSQQ_16920, partial [Candidatus Helarchaeota archaeon]
GVLCLFYLIFPIFVTLVRRVISAILLLVVMLFLASYYYNTVSVIPGLELYSYMSIITQLPFFLVGILIYLILRKPIQRGTFFDKRSTKVIGGVMVIAAVVLFSTLSWR